MGGGTSHEGRSKRGQGKTLLGFLQPARGIGP